MYHSNHQTCVHRATGPLLLRQVILTAERQRTESNHRPNPWEVLSSDWPLVVPFPPKPFHHAPWSLELGNPVIVLIEYRLPLCPANTRYFPEDSSSSVDLWSMSRVFSHTPFLCLLLLDNDSLVCMQTAVVQVPLGLLPLVSWLSSFLFRFYIYKERIIMTPTSLWCQETEKKKSFQPA